MPRKEYVFSTSTDTERWLGSADDSGCLIDKPGLNMAHPLIDLDMNLATKKMLRALKQAPGPRSKSIVGIVRGTGGGKTRCLEEIRRRFLAIEGTLVVAITFGHNSYIGNEDWPRGLSAEQKYALSIVSRMAFSVLHETNYRSIHRKMLGYLPLLGTAFEPEDLIREFTRILIQKMSDARGEPVTDFVMLMDEVLSVEEFLGNSSDSSDIRDITYMVRRALLNDNFTGNVRVALAISSLKMTSFGKAESGRGVLKISLPERLNASEIVTEWWRMGARNCLERCTLKLIASTVNSLPRAVSFVDCFLREELGARPINQIVVSELFEDLFESMEERYNCNPVPDSSLLYPMIFREKVTLGDRGVMDALRRSFYTNVINSYTPSSEIVRPESSLMMLRTAATIGTDEVFEAILNGIDTVLAKTAAVTSNSIGDFLETLYEEWLTIRIATASYHYAIVPTITLAKLLGIPEPKLPKESLKSNKNLLSALRAVITPQRTPTRTTLQHYSGDAEDEFFLDLLSVAVSNEAPLAIISPCSTSKTGRESFDVCLKAFIPERNEPLYVFIGCKSASESTELPRNDAKYATAILANPRQYEKTKNLAGKKALDFFYIYQTTYVVSSALVGSEGGALLLGRNEKMKCFGPAADMYCALRDSLPELRKQNMVHDDEEK